MPVFHLFQIFVEWLIIYLYMKIALIALFAVLSAATMVPHVGPVDTHIPKVYKMELNDSP